MDRTNSPTSGALPADADILALNKDERFFTESPSKYPEAGHGTQYRAGAPGVLGFARAVLTFAALASREASPAPLTTIDEIMQIARLSEGAFTIQSDKDRRNLIGDVCDALSTILRRHSDAALASPQVAPTPAQPSQWQPIDTAPKDRDVLLLSPKRGPVRGSWNRQEYHSKPRPYWTNDREGLFGVAETRTHPPTHWMPLPSEPEGESHGKS